MGGSWGQLGTTSPWVCHVGWCGVEQNSEKVEVVELRELQFWKGIWVLVPELRPGDPVLAIPR